MKEISEETIEKISQTKSEAGRQKIIEGMIKNDIPSQSNIKLAIPTHRTKEWISFEEFKDLLTKGKSLKELCIIYSKHLMAFYSYLSQGRVNLTKEQFEEEYEKGMALDEISKAHNIPREHITYLREYYGIKRKGAKWIKRLQNEVPLSQEAKDVIIGSILGDAHIHPLGYFSEKHSEKQVEYLEWKGEALRSISTPKSFYFDEHFDERYNCTNYSFCFRTIAHAFLYEMREKFYKEIDGKWTKIIPYDIEELLNEKVLAIWFMDDGSTDWGYRNDEKEYPNSKPQCKISSESFSLEGNLLLGKTLEKKYGLINSIRFRKPELCRAPYLRFDCSSSVKLISIVKKFATKDLLYKTDEQEYLRHQSLNVNKDEIKKNFLAKYKIDITKNIKNEK